VSWAFESRAPRATILLRLVVGAVFVTEGLQKFLFPDELGVGRFIKIGIPMPAVTAPFVGMVEVLGGALLIAGIATRIVCIPLLFNMLVAITSTKLVTLDKNGFWKTMHEARTDLLMIFCLLFLLAVGAGPLSLDGRRSPRGAR
jgi:putative oxidoreductase